MKKYLSLVFSIVLLVGLSFTTGCGTPKLEQGGAYAPVGPDGQARIQADLALFSADSAFKLAYQATDLVFTFERDNRAMLKTISPGIKEALDEIRPQAVEARDAYAKARKTYLANPTQEGLDLMDTIVAKIRQLSLAAQTAIPTN